MLPGSPRRIALRPITALPRSKCHLVPARSTGSLCEATAASTTPSTWRLSPKFVQPQPRARLLRPQDRRRKDGQGGHPSAQAPHQRCGLRTASARRQTDSRSDNAGPGRASRERLSSQRDRLTPSRPALRRSHSRTRDNTTTDSHIDSSERVEDYVAAGQKSLLTTKRPRSGAAQWPLPSRHRTCRSGDLSLHTGRSTADVRGTSTTL